ncbi:bifunctional diaminohydroxyphosphoribosylaminopyrimidine deaminase/5-amino-6-(5-phosphoribosylamino)uracil reductase RibD [Sandaracinus amylolyticus]|uniref:bifunctional diaminohydroxyphosphoribosylaminopyrimidine deaminase/5-amino-6-(5-phosphoribosylamino)uracil reductase RibD n=1 Tax=Sandaracinus amylolyticus TaxID=927083 RepID=UPI001F008ECB|nr:bifunctional diaminohydroxyphosphoribosylaminopyrimidine deaminase/5-amino-6-(5-phosphoribosylamino)uracil reductase RibD [Sandaracinus amylolyticus]UJR80476.1 Riboflavin biosynthesis protein RibD [Sandaracinus amylolyticus]
MSDTLALDERMMDLALAEARKGRTAPNPHVGAVIVQGGEVVGVGHHERAGEVHAEVDAMRAAGDRTRGATLYCTLEPCNHHGRTAPCTDAILGAGIARVVVGCVDPAKHGPTSGAARLRDAGVEVVLGVREPQAREVIEDFACLVTKKRPLVVLKAAVTLDGRIATRTGDSKWITGDEARREAHRLRDRADAVMVGVGTVLADDPRLDVRMIEGRDPIRVVLDTHLRTPETAQLVAHGSSRPTWIVHGPDAPEERRDALRRDGVVLIEAPLEGDTVDVAWMLAELGRRDVMRLLVEGGGRVHGALLDRGLADRAEIFVAPVVLGDPEARPLAAMHDPPMQIASAFQLADLEIDRLGRDVRFRGRVTKGPREA